MAIRHPIGRTAIHHPVIKVNTTNPTQTSIQVNMGHHHPIISNKAFRIKHIVVAINHFGVIISRLIKTVDSLVRLRNKAMVLHKHNGAEGAISATCNGRHQGQGGAATIKD